MVLSSAQRVQHTAIKLHLQVVHIIIQLQQFRDLSHVMEQHQHAMIKEATAILTTPGLDSQVRASGVRLAQ